MISSERIGRLLSPKSIAFVGGGVAGMCIKRCREMGYEGQIWPVHPTRKTIAGYRSYPSLDDLPSVPDATYIGVNRELTIELVSKLSAAGAGGCVCYAAGFAEIGEEGGRLQQELKEAAGDMPLVGPNCFGFINYLDRCALWPYLFAGERVDSGPALILQSGNIGMNLTMNKRSANFTYVIGAGNQAVLGPGHYIDALLRDDRVTAIGMYIEGFDDIDHFCRSASAALEKRVPIVVIKTGKTEASARQTSSHTSALTGSDDLYDAMFERLGVVRVDSLNRLLETLKILDKAGPIAGKNIVTLSCSGGEAALIADTAPRFGLDLPAFSPQLQQQLESQFPAYVTVSNPFDYNTSIWGDRSATERCFVTAMSDVHDAAILVYDHPTIDAREVDEWLLTLDAFIAAHRATSKPAFVLCTISELLPDDVRMRMTDAGVWPLQGLDDGLYAYAMAATYHERASMLAGNIVLPRSNIGGQPCQARPLDEYQSKQLLAEFGVAIPDGKIGTADEVASIALEIGFPVVVKALGPEFLHKSDLGAVKTGLNSVDEVINATREIQSACAALDMTVRSYLVEQMIQDSVVELIVGVHRDRQFGPALVIGAGGVLVELLAESRSLLLPTTRQEITAAVESLTVSRLIRGYRGEPAGDLQATVDVIVAVAEFAEHHWETLQELDVNPLLVLPDAAIAADAMITVSAMAAQPTRRAV